MWRLTENNNILHVTITETRLELILGNVQTFSLLYRMFDDVLMPEVVSGVLRHIRKFLKLWNACFLRELVLWTVRSDL